MDASTLGKIDVQGPDAVELLNRLYTNAYDSLAVGKCRYGVMCKPDGMVFDDGVVMRVGEERFLCTTTTGNAAPVLAWMEEWLQTEWPELRVWLTSVTEQWATVAVVGPDSRDLLGALTEIPLDNESFPFMAIREGEVAGIPARVCRISFSGELAFEVNVDGRRGLELWEAIDVAPARSRRTAPRRCTCCAPRRATRSSARTPTAPSRRRTSAWTGSSRRRSRTSSASARSRGPTRRGPTASSSSACCRSIRTSSFPRAHSSSPTRATRPRSDARPRHVELPQRRARAARSRSRCVESGRERIGETVHAPLPDRTIAVEIVDAVLYDREGARRDGRPV